MTTSPETRSWLWVLIGAALLNQITVHLVRPTTTYKLVALDADATTVGLVSAAYSLLPLLAAMSLGSLAQRLPSLTPLLIGGTVATGSGAAVVSSAEHVMGIAAGTTVMGVGQLVFIIAGQSAVARYSAGSELDRGFGWFTAGFAGGQLVGPLVGGLLLDGVTAGEPASLPTIDLALWLGTAACLPAAILLLLLRPPHRERRSASRPEASGRSPDSTKPKISAILGRPGIGSAMLASLCLVATVDILTAFLPLIGAEAGVSPAWIGALLAVRAGTTIASRFLLPALRRRVRRSTLVVAALTGSALTLAPIPLTITSTLLSATTMAAAGFFLGLGQPLTMSQVVEAVPRTWQSSALALRLSGNRLGQVVVPLAAGAAAAPAGAGGAVWLS
ncbi:MAG: MFS transporter, partial [Nesterenkonia sp.]|nr:MFS transporter [Nesterenkonia sp.]